MAKKLISVVTPCYNEEDNVEAMVTAVREVFQDLPTYDYEHIFIDKASKDQTVRLLKDFAAKDPHVKIIVNSRNFGHLRSPYYAMLQATGDAIVHIVSDLQEPPAMIKDFIAKWEEGYRIVMGVNTEAEESAAMFAIRKFYYNLINRLSDVALVKNFNGFGLYDRSIVEILRNINDPYPYFRGLISDVGFEPYQISYRKLTRKRGITKNNFYTLYDLAILGITNYSKVPLHLATMAGFGMAAISLVIAFGYFLAKLIFWNSFSLGTAPVVIGLFFFSSVQLFFIGIIGEYIGSIHTQTLKRPLVIEKERINF